jgi:AcrR family transcriptional regulator
MKVQNKAERTRAYIIEKTAPIFNEKGFSGTSLNDMIAATNLTKGSIYGNFVNKDEVALAAFDYNFGKVVQLISKAISVQISAIDKLLVYPHVYYNFLEIPFLKAGCPLLNTSVEADDTHPALREKAVKALLLWRKSVERIITDGIRNKELKERADAKLNAVILTSLIEGAVMQAKLTNSAKELHMAMDYLERKIKKLKR